MVDEEGLRRRLEKYRDATIAAEDYDSSGWWIGPNGETDAADVNRNRQDEQSGRLWWKTAHNNAVSGLEALDQGNLDLATIYAWSASDFMIATLTKLVRRDEWRRLEKSAVKAGRKPIKPKINDGQPRRPRGRPRKNSGEPKKE